jgi:hypothetical protein
MSSYHVFISCLHIVSSYRVFISCLHIMSSYHVFISCLHIMSSYHVFISCLHIMSSYRVFISCLHIMSSYHVFISCLHIMPSYQASYQAIVTSMSLWQAVSSDRIEHVTSVKRALKRFSSLARTLIFSKLLKKWFRIENDDLRYSQQIWNKENLSRKTWKPEISKKWSENL